MEGAGPLPLTAGLPCVALPCTCAAGHSGANNQAKKSFGLTQHSHCYPLTPCQQPPLLKPSTDGINRKKVAVTENSWPLKKKTKTVLPWVNNIWLRNKTYLCISASFIFSRFSLPSFLLYLCSSNYFWILGRTAALVLISFVFNH